MKSGLGVGNCVQIKKDTMQKNNFGVIDDFMQLNIFQNFLCVTFGLHLVYIITIRQTPLLHWEKAKTRKNKYRRFRTPAYNHRGQTSRNPQFGGEVNREETDLIRLVSGSFELGTTELVMPPPFLTSVRTDRYSFRNIMFFVIQDNIIRKKNCWDINYQ